MSDFQDTLHTLVALPHVTVLIASLCSFVVSVVWFSFFPMKGFAGVRMHGELEKSKSFYVRMGCIHVLLSYVLAFSLRKIGISYENGSLVGIENVWYLHGVGMMLGVMLQARYHNISLKLCLMMVAYLSLILASTAAVLMRVR